MVIPASKSFTIWSTSQVEGLKQNNDKVINNLPQCTDNFSFSLTVINLHKDLISFYFGKFTAITHCFFPIFFTINDTTLILVCIFGSILVVGQVLWLDF